MPIGDETDPTRDPWLGPDPQNVRDAVRFRVGLFEAAGDEAGASFEELDNVVVMSVSDPLGTDPGTARVRYRFTGMDPDAPQSFEEALADGVDRRKLITEGDRVVIQAQPPGSEEWVPIFDGFALGFELALAKRREVVSILLVGVGIRCWDDPVDGAIFRDGDRPHVIIDTPTDVTAHFNPKGKGNCLGGAKADDSAGDARAHWNPGEGGDTEYPTFIDPDNPATAPDTPTLWYYHTFVRYLLFTQNKLETWVKNPAGYDIDSLLWSREPVSGTTYNLSDPTSYTKKRIAVPDKPATGRNWPKLIEDVIGDKGFAWKWTMEGDDAGYPTTRIELIQPADGEPKDVLLQPRGSVLDVALSNVAGIEASRSLSEAANDWTVRGELEEVEISFILAPLFPMAAADAASASAIAAYSKSDANYLGTKHNTYRLFGIDEIGEGHYQPASSVRLTNAFSFDAVFGAPIEDADQWSRRRRPPVGKLLTKDPLGTVLDATLEISTDYTGASPSIYGLTGATGGTWQPISGGYQLLKNRVGIYLTVENPNEWKIGTSATTGHPYRTGVVRAVEALAKNAANYKAFTLRLTCVIRGDRRVSGRAKTPLNAVITQPIARVIDAHDRYKKQRVLAKSRNNPGSTDNVVRDDTPLALAEASAIQQMTMNGVFGGKIVIPRFTRFYKKGDRIRSIQGRGLGFRTDNGGSEATPTFPIVMDVCHPSLEDQQTTVLTLSDANFARHNYARKIKKPTHEGKA